MTRAGWIGSISSTELAKNATNTGTQVAGEGANGFGVFAYYTGKDNYAKYQKDSYESGGVSTENHAPNFMYNQRVYHDAGNWVYTPLKYWPNEGVNNTTDNYVDDQDGDEKNNPATTAYENGGYVSFFAYAPYVFFEGTDIAGDIEAATPTTGSKKIQQPKTGTANYNSGTTTGIIAVTGNSEPGDPKIRYKLAEKNAVDLLWGTTWTNGGKASSGVPYTNDQPGVSSNKDGDNYQKAIYAEWNASHTNHTKEYTLNADLQKMNVAGKVGFNFKHALSKVGGSSSESITTIIDPSDDDPTTPTNGLMVVLDLDKDEIYETGSALESATGIAAIYDATTCKYKTKVTIESIEIQSNSQVNAAGKAAQTAGTYKVSDNQEEGLVGEGVFNLATGKWTTEYDNSGTPTHYSNATIDHLITQNSGDANSSAILNDNIKEPASFASLYTDNVANRQKFFKGKDGSDIKGLPIGVTTVPKNVYGTETNPLVFIPGSRPVLTITVVYYVRTYDANLQNQYSEVKQKITKKMAFGEDVMLNKQYNLIMHLGLTSVKFTATVAEWDVASNVTGNDGPDGISGTEDDVITYQEDVEHVYLPINVGLHKMQKFEVTYDGNTSTQTAGEKRTDITFTGATALTKTDVSGAGGAVGGQITSVTTTLRDQADDGNKEYSRQWPETTYETTISSSSDNYKYVGNHNLPGTSIDGSGNIGLEPNYTTAARTVTVTVAYNKRSETYNPTTQTITITQKAASAAPTLSATNDNVAVDATSYEIPAVQLNFTDGTNNYSYATGVNARCTFAQTGGDLAVTITGNTLTFAANTTGTDKTAEITVTYTDFDGGTIVKTITITQAGS